MYSENYYVREISADFDLPPKRYIIHRLSGTSLEIKGGYSSQYAAYWAIPEYKRAYFYDWYFSMTKGERKSMIANRIKWESPDIVNPTGVTNTVATYTWPVVIPRAIPEPGLTTVYKEQEKEHDMRTNIAVDTGFNAEREYLDDRLYEAAADKHYELKKVYNLLDDDAPRTAKELVERIASGKYILPTEKEEEAARRWGANPWSQIRWRDPDAKEDKEGFEVASKEVHKAKQRARDVIKTLDAVEGLKALQEFEATTFH